MMDGQVKLKTGAILYVFHLKSHSNVSINQPMLSLKNSCEKRTANEMLKHIKNNYKNRFIS